jgi:hypothetical protein
VCPAPRLSAVFLAMVRFPLLLVLLAASTSHRALTCAATTTTSTTSTSRVATHDPEPVDSTLAEVPTPLAGGALRARLPRGTLASEPSRERTNGVLVQSIHVVRRSFGTVSLTAVDTGERVGEDFRARVAETERTLRCVRNASVPFPVAHEVEGPSGTKIIGIVSDVACPGTRPPEARIWVRTEDGSVICITFGCLSNSCLPDRANVLEEFVRSIDAGTPTEAPAGTRTFGPSSSLMVSVEVPEGYFVRSTVGEARNTYEIFRRHDMGEPRPSVSFTFLLTRSRNSLREDYARQEARTRMVRGLLAGQRTRFLELKYRGRTERIGRLTLGAADLDVGIVGTNAASLSELRAIVAAAHLPTGEGP